MRRKNDRTVCIYFGTKKYILYDLCIFYLSFLLSISLVIITFNTLFVHRVGLNCIIWSRSTAISLTALGGSERRDAPTLINSNNSFLRIIMIKMIFKNK